MHLQAHPQTLALSRWPTGHRYPHACPEGQTLPSVTLAPNMQYQLTSTPGMAEHKETWGRMTTEPEWLGAPYTWGTTWTHKPAPWALTSPKQVPRYSGAPGGRSSFSQPHHTTGGSKALAAVKTTGKELFVWIGRWSVFQLTATSNSFILLNNPLQPPKAAGIYHSCTTTWEGRARDKLPLWFQSNNHPELPAWEACPGILPCSSPVWDAAGQVYSKWRSRKGEAVLLSRLCSWWQREVRPSDSACSLSSWHVALQWWGEASPPCYKHLTH